MTRRGRIGGGIAGDRANVKFNTKRIEQSMKSTTFNLNDKIKVKLTQAGYQHLKQKNYKLTTDREGYLILSLWEFSGIFGDALQLPTFNPPVEPDIILLVE